MSYMNLLAIKKLEVVNLHNYIKNMNIWYLEAYEEEWVNSENHQGDRMIA